MESLILKNGKSDAPVKDSKVQGTSTFSENTNPNMSHASPTRPPLSKSVASPLLKSVNSKKSQVPNPNPTQPVFPNRNRIRERRFVVVAKKHSRKGMKDPAPAESTVADVDCKCGERKKGNVKCVCTAYERLQALQEEFLNKRTEPQEEKGGLEDCCNFQKDAGDGDELEEDQYGEPEKIDTFTMKRPRAKAVEESRRSVPESGKLTNLEEAFEKLTCFSLSENQTEEDTKKQVKWEFPGMRQQPKFLEGEKEQNPWNSSFCPSELVLTANNLGLEPNASISSSWNSSHCSVLSGNSNAGSRKKQVKVTSLKPFKLRTEKRGRVKEEEFAKKLQKMKMEEENMRIPIAQWLPLTTDEPECLVKPPVKDITRPLDLMLHSDVRAVKRAEFDYLVAEKMSYIEQYKMERERQEKLAEEEEIRRIRKELVPKAQPMPYFDRPFIPRRSSKLPTAARDPKFHIRQHKRMRCCNSSCWSETGACMSDVHYQYL